GMAGIIQLSAGDRSRAPLYVHAMCVNSYSGGAWRCVDGGSQIAKLLIRELHKHGGKSLKYKEVVQFHIEDGILRAVSTSDGKVYQAGSFIANIDPKRVLDLIGDFPIRKSYVNRIRTAEHTISSFSLYIVLRSEEHTSEL